MLDALGMERGVLVQPSVYGTDNQAMLDAMAGKPRLRGIAVVPYDVNVAEIERLHGLGVRGVRCNIVDLKFGKGALPLDQLKPLAARIKPRLRRVLSEINEFADLDRQLADFPVDVRPSATCRSARAPRRSASRACWT
jgi:predicted TIM-barrel fold metal-dependent hydrolase